MRPRYTVPMLIGTASLAVALTGCGGSSDAASDGQGSGGQQGGGGSTLTITEPSNGADVQAPFTLKFNPGVEIGPEESGKDHVHVFLDGKSNEYEVVTTTEYQVKNIPPGEHVVGVSLQHADHSPVGPKTEVKVNVTGGGSTGGGDDAPPDYGPGGGY